MFNLVLIAIVGLTTIWIIIVHEIPFKARIFLCRHQYIFLMIHIPIMYLMTMIGGEGLIFGLANLIGGCISQLYLATWGTRYGLTFSGKKTAKYYKLFPKKKKKVRKTAALPPLVSQKCRPTTIKRRVNRGQREVSNGAVG